MFARNCKPALVGAHHGLANPVSAQSYSCLVLSGRFKEPPLPAWLAISPVIIREILVELLPASLQGQFQ
jgi:hypothetical protein